MPEQYLAMLGIQGKEFETSKGTWTAKVPREPDPGMTDRLKFRIYFEAGKRKPGWQGPSIRNLDLELSGFQLRHHHDEYVAGVLEFIKDWLESGAVQEEREFPGRDYTEETRTSGR